MHGSSYKLYFKFLRRVESKLYTGLYKVKYWPVLQTGRNCVLNRGLVVKPFVDLDGRLKIILEGENQIGAYTVFQGSGPIIFGKGSFCGEFCVFGANSMIRIGSRVMIGQNVTVRDTDHEFETSSKDMIYQSIRKKAVEVENNVWIGHGAIILKGVRVGAGSVVGAGAVVTKDVPRGTVVGGVPARTIRHLSGRPNTNERSQKERT